MIKFLDEHESAPSALAIVKSIWLCRDLTKEEFDALHERSEGECDAERNDYLQSFRPDQIAEIAVLALEILQEKHPAPK